MSCASMDPSWLQAIPANVRRNQSGRPASSRRLSSCKSLSLKSFDLENRGFAGGALAAVGTALETPPLSGPKLAHLLAGLTDGSVWGGASADRLIPSAAASTALWKLSANKDQSRRASDSGLRKHHSQLRAVPPKGDLSGEASLPGGVLGATLDPPRKEEVATGKAVLAAIVGDLAAPNAVSASEPIEELTSAALTSAVRPVIARRRSALPQRNGEERKGAVGGQKTTLEKATAGGGTTKTKPSITGETATGTTVGILQKIVPPGIVEEIGPWSTSESRRRESSKGTVPDFSRRESDDFSAIERGESSYNAASADIDDISDDVSGDDASSSSSESDLAERSAELASFSGRGIPILDPSSGCADLPFRDFMPLGRLRGGSRGSASIGALQSE